MGVLSTLSRGAKAVYKSNRVREMAKSVGKSSAKFAWEGSGASRVAVLEGSRNLAVKGLGYAKDNHITGSKPTKTPAAPANPGSGIGQALMSGSSQPAAPQILPTGKDVDTQEMVRLVQNEGNKNRRVVSEDTRAKISAANRANSEQRTETRRANADIRRQAEADAKAQADANAAQKLANEMGLASTKKAEMALDQIADNTKALVEAQTKSDSVFAKKGQGAAGAGGAGGSGGGIISSVAGGLLGMAGSAAAGGLAGRVLGKIPGVGSLVSKIPGLGGFAAGAGADAAKTVGEGAAKTVGKTAASEGVKAGAKGIGKALLKKIPLIGALAGLGFGAKRAFAGDWTGAGLEVASGLASTIPGAGTGASIAIDAGLAARDVMAENGEKPETPVTPTATPTALARPAQTVNRDATVAASVVNRSDSNVFSRGDGDPAISLLSALTDAMLNADKGIYVKAAKDPFGEDLTKALSPKPMEEQGGGGSAPAPQQAVPVRQAAEGDVAVRPLGGAGFVPNSERPGRERAYMGGGYAPQARVSAPGSPEMAVTGRAPDATRDVQVKGPAVSPGFKAGAAGKGFGGFGADVDKDIADSAKKSGIPEDVLRGFVKMEDGWTGKMSPTGAIGTGQFIQSTWDGLAKTKEGQEIGMTKIGDRFRKEDDPRRDKRVNTMATGLLAKQNAEQLRKAGLEPTGENLYMMHNIGPGVIPVLQGKPASEATLTAMKHNGMKPGQTGAEFVAMQKEKYNKHYAAANSADVLAKSNASAELKTAAATPGPVESKAAPAVAEASAVQPSKTSSQKVQAAEVSAETKAAESRKAQPQQPIVVAAPGASPAPQRQASPMAGSTKPPLIVRNNQSSIARVADNMISRTIT